MKKLTLLTLIISMALSTVSFAGLQREIWWDTNVGNVAAAWAVVNSGRPADLVDVIAESGFGDQGVDYYVASMSGWIVAPVDGDYIFYVCSDDNSELLVSPNDDPAGAVSVATTSGWAGDQDWTNGNVHPSEPITLAAGQLIAIDSAMNEGNGGDNFSIGWMIPDSNVVTLIPDDVTLPSHPTKASYATAASPGNGATDVIDGVLSWAPVGAEAPVYDVLVGTAPDALEILAEGLTEATTAMVLAPDTTYYWRVDVSGSEGFLWSFTTVGGAPVITSATGDAQLLGGAAQLKVEATSIIASTFTYQWRRLNFELAPGMVLPDVLIPGAESATLDIDPVTAADQGEYYCVVTNEYGDTASAAVFMDAQTGLINRWSFGDSADGVTLPDSVGGADAVLVNTTGLATVGDGQVNLGNDGAQNSNGAGDNLPNGDYVDLPNGLVSSLTQMTIEVWTTWHNNTQTWARVYDIGTSAAGEGFSNNGAGYFCVNAKSNTDSMQMEYSDSSGAPSVRPGGRLPLDEEVMITQVHDEKAGLVKLYINGVAVAGLQPVPFALKTMNDNNIWLGRSQWGDPLYAGSYNDFRIYDMALSAEQVAADYLAGPDALGVLPESCNAEFTRVGDLNGDCVYDLLDAAMLADTWLVDSLNKAAEITELQEE